MPVVRCQVLSVHVCIGKHALILPVFRGCEASTPYHMILSSLWWLWLRNVALDQRAALCVPKTDSLTLPTGLEPSLHPWKWEKVHLILSGEPSGSSFSIYLLWLLVSYLEQFLTCVPNQHSNRITHVSFNSPPWNNLWAVLLSGRDSTDTPALLGMWERERRAEREVLVTKPLRAI